MLDKLTAFFKQQLHPDNTQDEQHTLQQACAVLLIEVSRADNQQDACELSEIQRILSKVFTLSEQQLAKLLELGNTQEASATGLYPFTSLIKEHYAYPQRVNLIKMMWQVAYADGDLSKYEDHIIRKVADLLYVSHSDFIQAKLSVVKA